MMDGLLVSVEAETEEALLLREFGHRAMNDLTVARCAIAITRRAVGEGSDGLATVLDEAAARIDGAGSLMRLLAQPVGPCVDLGARLALLCGATVGARIEASAVTLQLDLPAVWVDGVLARRVTLIAAELVANACRHGLAGRSGTISVTLRRTDVGLVLEVADDGPLESTGRAGTGLGGGIVGSLARLAGGSVELDRAPTGAVATLRVPLPQEQAMSIVA